MRRAGFGKPTRNSMGVGARGLDNLEQLRRRASSVCATWRHCVVPCCGSAADVFLGLEKRAGGTLQAAVGHDDAHTQTVQPSLPGWRVGYYGAKHKLVGVEANAMVSLRFRSLL